MTQEQLGDSPSNQPLNAPFETNDGRNFLRWEGAEACTTDFRPDGVFIGIKRGGTCDHLG